MESINQKIIEIQRMINDKCDDMPTTLNVHYSIKGRHLSSLIFLHSITFEVLTSLK